MARLFIDGFELRRYQLWDADGTSGITSGGVGGSYCLNYGAGQIKTLSSSYSDLYYAAHVRLLGSGYSDRYINFRSAGSNVASCRGNASNKIEVYRGDGTNLLDTSTLTMPVDQWFHLMVHFKPDTGSSGRWEVYVNGVRDINFTGQTTVSATTVDGIQIGNVSIQQFSFDNIVIDSSALPGNSVIVACAPTGADTTNWTASSGSNWNCVDETPYSLTDFVYSNATATIDLYAAGDLPSTAESVKCVQVCAHARASGNSTPTKLALGVKSGVTSGYSSDKALNYAVGTTVSNIWETNPATSNPWTPSEVNGMLIGMQSKA